MGPRVGIVDAEILTGWVECVSKEDRFFGKYGSGRECGRASVLEVRQLKARLN